jgi:hypothetical protein
MTVSIQNLVGLTTSFNANLGNLRNRSPLFEYLSGRIEDALGDHFVQFNAKDPFRSFSTSASSRRSLLVLVPCFLPVCQKLRDLPY